MTGSKNELRLPEIALLESRMAEQLERLFRRHGASPHTTPAVREVPEDATQSVDSFIDRLSESGVDLVILQTGVSVTELARTAERIGRLTELETGLESVITVCRGPKPTAALKKLGVRPTIAVATPHTTEDIITALRRIQITGRSVTVIHHGDRNERLIAALREQTHRIDEIYLYRWQLPEDTGPLEALCRSVVKRRYDAIAFTSQVQIRHLFQIAERLGMRADLTDVLNRNTIVAAVGPTCAAALQQIGIQADVVPENPKMEHMVLCLMERLEAVNGSDKEQLTSRIRPVVGAAS